MYIYSINWSVALLLLPELLFLNKVQGILYYREINSKIIN